MAVTLSGARARRIGFAAVVAVVILVPWLEVTTPVASAASTITVTTTADETTTNGQCSLREAVGNANADSATNPDCAAGNITDTIVFDLGPDPATITLDPGLGRLQVTDNDGLVVDGAGKVTLSGGDATQIFELDFARLTLDGLILTQGSGFDFGLGSLAGGAITNQDGQLVVRDSLISDNHAAGNQGAGGGIFSVGGSLDVSGSTFQGNSSAVGGAVDITSSQTTITNSTFEGNTAENNGGAVTTNQNPGVGNTTAVTYSTFSQNSSFFGGAISGDARIEADVFSANPATDGNCAGAPVPPVSDLGYTVSSDASCATAATSVASTDPGLVAGGPVDNGGPTPTIALADGSTAIDRVPVGQAGCGAPVTADQRGSTRPVDGDDDGTAACDSGSYERGAVLHRGTLRLTSAADQVSEADGSAVLHVERVDGSTGVVTVDYTTADGSAKAPDDYTTTSGTLTFDDGVTTGTITVPIVDDAVHEPTEDLTVTISQPGGGAVLGGPSQTMVTITDDDPAPLPGACTIVGTAGPDVLHGTPGRDVICARGGNDQLFGGGGNDVLIGGGGNDVLRGGDGRDVLQGGAGADRMSGQSERDTLAGGLGSDELAGGTENDSLSGGAGADGLRGQSGDDRLAGGAGNDRLVGGSGIDQLLGGAGHDVTVP
jgi:CSLREA domain-containing protein